MNLFEQIIISILLAPLCIAIIMILIACLLLYLAIVKQFEPLLLLPIAFGMLLTNLAGAEMFHEELFADGHVHWNLFAASNYVTPGLVDILYLGVKLGIKYQVNHHFLVPYRNRRIFLHSSPYGKDRCLGYL